MRFMQENAKIISKTEIAKNIFDCLLNCPSIAKKASPGQFINILVKGKTLRRPISICDIDKDNENIRIVFEIRGEGTEILAKKQAGDFYDITGPLGNGFLINDFDKKAVFVGGGIGTPPLFGAAKLFSSNAAVFLGFRSRSAVILEEDFKLAKNQIFIATDDGSYGYKGLITEPLKEHLEKNKCDIIYSCGPTPMLKAVSNIAESFNVPCKISLEQRMACGVGACLTCACKVKEKDGSEKFTQLCRFGPVFNSKEVVL